MPRTWDEDEDRLPAGMVRVGYDADTQTYTYRDSSNGSCWEGNPGNRYGRLHQVSTRGTDRPSLSSNHQGGEGGQQKISWRQHYNPLLNFFLLCTLFLLAVFWFMHHRASGGSSGSGEKEAPQPACDDGWDVRRIVRGDTCWDVAQGVGITVEALLGGNLGLDCDGLRPGMKICVPGASE